MDKVDYFKICQHIHKPSAKQIWTWKLLVVLSGQWYQTCMSLTFVPNVNDKREQAVYLEKLAIPWKCQDSVCQETKEKTNMTHCGFTSC